jgi:hypothetical protein
MFPQGWPGLGLLFLRSSVAVALLAEGYGRRDSLSGWLQAAAILLSLTLFAGYLTPIAAAIGMVLHGLIWVKFGGGSAALPITVSLDAIALAIVGPGGYSVDASRFGRRVIVLPPT